MSIETPTVSLLTTAWMWVWLSIVEDAWRERRPHHLLRFTRNTWASLEVFNLLKVSNKASNTWIKTIYNSQYAVPNYLTGRRINLRIRVDL